MKKGMRNRPSSTRCLRVGRLGPSKGREPQTRTYSTTPRLCEQPDSRVGAPLASSRDVVAGSRVQKGSYPDVQLGAFILLSLKDFGRCIGGAPTPRGQGLSWLVEIPKSKICEAEEQALHQSGTGKCNGCRVPWKQRPHRASLATQSCLPA